MTPMDSTSSSGRIDAEDRAPSDEDCNADSWLFKPLVDVRRCEGKAECVAVCPYGVFEIGRLSDAAFNAMPPRPAGERQILGLSGCRSLQ